MLITLKDILKNTKKEKYAVGGFNFNSFEDAQGMIDGARELKSPIILMASMGAVKHMGIDQCVGIVRGMAKTAGIPVCLHLDHATDLELIRDCIDAGFTSVMIDASKKNYEDNINICRSVVEYANKMQCSVEAELGKIGGREENILVDSKEAMFTNPEDVSEFVSRTGIDALAVAIGTAHGFYTEKPKLDFERLKKINLLTDIPLVLHGGTGIPDEDFRKAINIGMSKINVGTELKQAFVNTIKESVEDEPEVSDPRPYMLHVRNECAQRVKNKIRVFGSEGKA